MKLRLLLIFLIPFFAFSQGKRTLATKKMFEKAVEAYNAGNNDEALTMFKQCVTDDPTFTEAYLNISYIYFESEDYSNSLGNSLKALQTNQFQSSIFIQTARCYYHLEQYDSTVHYMKQGSSLGAISESDYVYVAKSLTFLGEYRESTIYFGKAIELNSNNSLYYNERGNAYFQLGEYELAKADFEKALQLNPQSSSAIANMANVALAMGDNETAMTYIEKGISGASDEQKIDLLILKGNYYKNTGDFENASAAYNEAYELDQENAVVLNNQAAVLIELEDYQGAFEKCNLALEIQPEMMEAYFNRGIANEMLRNVEDACMDWEQAFILGSEIAEEYLNSPICIE